MPGARKTPGVAVGRSLLPSPEEWAVRNRELTRNLVELITEYAPDVTGRALDVGCQWGVMLDNLARETKQRWWGADPVIEHHFSRAGHELVPGTADALPFPDGVFDCVVLANVYEHIPPAQRDSSLVEMRRVLAPGGVVVGQLPNPHFPIESHSKLPLMGWLPARAQNVYWKVSPSRRGAGFYSVTATDLTRRAKAAGYEVALVRKYNYPVEAAPQSVRWLVRLMRRPMSLLPWSWQFVLRRPADGGEAQLPASAGDDIYRDRAALGLEEAAARSRVAARLVGLVTAFEAGEEQLPNALEAALAVLDGAARPAAAAERFAIDGVVLERAYQLAGRGSDQVADKTAGYRGPEWQWMQEALRLFAIQAGQSADGPPAAHLAAADFRSEV